MKKLIALIAFTVFTTIAVNAQDQENPKKIFIILLSTKNYAEAKKFATKASETLELTLDLRNLYPNSKIGLSYHKEQCKIMNTTYPYVTPRGFYSNEDFVSVEYSSQYKGFAKGYYIVVASVYTDKDIANEAMIKIKENYKTAYTKNTIVKTGDYTK